MSEKDERRRYPRFPTDEVQGSFSYSVKANVDNLSLGGFAVRTSAQLQVGRRYNFRLGEGSASVQLEGEVKWCRLAGTEKLDTGDVVPVYSAGIAFEDILTTNAEQLHLFMEKNVILDLKQRIFGRLKVESESEIDLQTESKFLVKQLSASGMLIITELPPKPESICSSRDTRTGGRCSRLGSSRECCGTVSTVASMGSTASCFTFRAGLAPGARR